MRRVFECIAVTVRRLSVGAAALAKIERALAARIHHSPLKKSSRMAKSLSSFSGQCCAQCKIALPMNLVTCSLCMCTPYCSESHRDENHFEGGHFIFCEQLGALHLASMKEQAKDGNEKCMHWLGEVYSAGLCRVAKVMDAAVAWHKRSAALGFPPAQRDLGCLYRDGEGVERDYAESLRLFRLASAQGDAAAHYGVVHAYHDGLGVAVDFVRAVRHFRIAAEGVGFVSAQSMFDLGGCYLEGNGVPRSLSKARKWLVRPKKEGYDSAKLNDRLAKVDACIAAEAAAIAAAAAAAAESALEAACIAADRVAAELIAEEDAEKAAAAGKGKRKGKGVKGEGKAS